MRAHVALVIVTTLAWPVARLSSQSISVNAANGVLHVQAPGFHFIDGEPLERLKDGRSVRVELALIVLAKPGATPAAQRKQTCVLSYDLWEERFAVTLAEVPARSASHLTSTAAEVWCVQQLDVPLSALGPLARNLPFWLRLESRAVGDESAERPEGGFTLRDLIDALSRRPKPGEVSRSIEAGPFRVQN
jgi:hypothetical protein